MNTDFDLVRKAQTGDMSAFTELVRRHDREVLALAARYVCNAEDAKDVFQEVMIKVYQALPGFQFRSDVGTWIYRITVNTCLTHKKKMSRSSLHVPLHRENGGDGSGRISHELHVSDDGPDHAAAREDAAAHLERALLALSPRQRMVFTLRHYEGRSLKEIAGILRCTEGTVKRYLFTATRRMRLQLEGLF